MMLSELDDSRQTHLLSTIQHKVQTFVTTTSVDGIDHEIMNNAKLYRINQGEIYKVIESDGEYIVRCKQHR